MGFLSFLRRAAQPFVHLEPGCLTLLLLAMAPAGRGWAQGPTIPPLLDRQVAVFADSLPGALCTSPQGHLLVIAEGGDLTFVDMWDDSSGTWYDTASPNQKFTHPTGDKKVPIGRMAPLPARMILDPTVGEEVSGRDGNPVWDRVYIAAGRSGLWAMEANTDSGWDPTTSAQPWAWRLDDSGNLDPATQNSRRWCNDVAVVSIGDPGTGTAVQYLVALFSKLNSNRLRVYRLSDVRAHTTASTQELGPGLVPLLQVNLGAHPVRSSPPPCAGPDPAREFGGSFGLAMATDQWLVTPGDVSSTRADIYVALGHDGIARVRLHGLAGGTLASSTDWGPIFGCNSPYLPSGSASVDGSIPREALGDVPYAHSIAADVPELDRLERPVFADVLVHRWQVTGQEVGRLFAAVDTLNWAVFDLGADPAADQFGSNMPLVHLHGVARRHDSVMGADSPRWVVDPVTEHPAAGQGYQYGGDTCSAARDLDLAQVNGTPYLLVSHTDKPYLRDYEGFAHEGHTYGTTTDYHASWDLLNSHTMVFAYSLLEDLSSTSILAGLGDQGGHQVIAPRVQSDPTEILAYTSVKVHGQDPCPTNPQETGVAQLRVPIVAPPLRFHCPTTTHGWVRGEEHYYGRQVFTVTESVVEPNLLILPINDGGIRREGFATLVPGPNAGEYEPLVLPGSTTPGGPTIESGPNGPFTDLSGQWPNDPLINPVQQGQAGNIDAWQVAFGHLANPGQPLVDGERELIMLLGMQVHDSSGGIDPIVREHYWFHPLPDSFEAHARQIYNPSSAPGHSFLDQFTGPDQGSTSWFVMVSQYGTREGLQLYSIADLGQIAATGSPQFSSWNLGDLPAPLTCRSQQLVTHPELNWIPANEQTTREKWASAEGRRGRSRLFTWWSEVVEVNALPESAAGELPPGTRWVLIVACGRVNADPRWALMRDSGGSSAWLPSAFWQAHLFDAMIQVWPILEPSHDAGSPETNWWRAFTVSHPGLDPLDSADDVPGNSSLAKGFARAASAPSGPSGNAYRTCSIRLVDPNAGIPRTLTFLADWGGSLHAFDISDILQTHDPGNLDREFLAEATWQAPAAVMDRLPNGVFDVEVQDLGDGRVRVYASVRRVGIQSLIYDPTTKSFSEESLNQLPGYVMDAQISTDTDGTTRLITTDGPAGVRVFGERQ